MASNGQIGTPHAGYADASHGPFACHNCEHYSWPHLCNHPDVIEDAEHKAGQGLHLHKSGKAIVEPGACCNYFRPK